MPKEPRHKLRGISTYQGARISPARRAGGDGYLGGEAKLYFIASPLVGVN